MGKSILNAANKNASEFGDIGMNFIQNATQWKNSNNNNKEIGRTSRVKTQESGTLQ